MVYDTDDFESDVIKRSHNIPILVDFWAAWCGPCKALGPILEKLALQNEDRWILAKLDTEKHPTIAARYGIRSIPNVKLFIEGQVTDEFAGALPENQVVEWLDKILPNKHSLRIDEAEQLLEGNKTSQAQKLLEMILSEEPRNEQASVLLARILLTSDSEKALKTVEYIGLGSKYLDATLAIRALTQMLQLINEPQTLQDDAIRHTYLAGIRGICDNNFETALTAFIEVVRKNRYYDDDGARKACIAIFHLLGENHEVTQRHRRALGSALF